VAANYKTNSIGQADLSVTISQEVILYEVNESAAKIETEIAKILELSKNKGNKKLELLIDGGVFAKMLMANT